MKIGKFSEVNNLSVDTVRHYMSLDLIVPIKEGAQYEFDERCQKDLEDILVFKGMGFELKEIKSIFYYKRLANLTPYEEDTYYKEFFENKHEIVSKEIIRLSHIKDRLEEKIIEVSSKITNVKRKIGVDIKALEYLCCNKCKENLSLADGSIVDNQILNGRLTCRCGEEYLIDDGILIVNNNYKIKNKEINHQFITDYINNTSSKYLDNIYKGHEWVNQKIDFSGFNNKILLELGSGMGFSLRYMYEDIPNTSMYIAVDHDLNAHKFLKATIERTELKKNILFICTDFLDIPLKDSTIDVLLDFSGSSNYSFENTSFLLEAIDKYVKKEAELLGSYILFKNFSKDSSVNKEYRDGFNIQYIRNKLHELGYKKIYDRASELVDEGGKYESYFKNGEEVFFYIFFGKR